MKHANGAPSAALVIVLTVIRHAFAVCSWAQEMPAYSKVGTAEKKGGSEGKIKQPGTIGAVWWAKPLSAHCFDGALPAPEFLGRSAAILFNVLALFGIDRHHSGECVGIGRVRPGARP
jgi:hypothetical protein